MIIFNWYILYSLINIICVKKSNLIICMYRYYDPKTGKVAKKSTNDNNEKLQRTFCYFILDPIYKVK